MKHTEKYYINKIDKILKEHWYEDCISSYRSWCTPSDRWVYIEAINWKRIFESRSREKLLNELKVLFCKNI